MPRIGAESVCDGEAGGAAADDDVVIGGEQLGCGGGYEDWRWCRNGAGYAEEK